MQVVPQFSKKAVVIFESWPYSLGDICKMRGSRCIQCSLFIALRIPAKNVRYLKGHPFFVCGNEISPEGNQLRVAIGFTRNGYAR